MDNSIVMNFIIKEVFDSTMQIDSNMVISGTKMKGNKYGKVKITFGKSKIN